MHGQGDTGKPVEAPPSTGESLKSIKDALAVIRIELKVRPALDTAELEDALHYADAFMWRVVETLQSNADHMT